jgi:hypothetical protein
MKTTKKMQRLLERMARVDKMERGKLCKMGSRPHYNHQSWQNGRNVVRYVPAAQKDFVEEAIEGYNEFMRLAEQYADEVIKHTRKEQARRFPKKDRRKKTNRPQKPKKGPCKKIDS